MKSNPSNLKKRRKKLYQPHPRIRDRRAVWLNVLPSDRWIKVKRDFTLLETLQKAAIDIESDCGGDGTCGKCKVRIVTALGPPDEQEKKLLSKEELERGERLACRVRIRKSLVVYTDEPPSQLAMVQILKHGRTPDVTLDPLIEKLAATVPAPSLEHPESDFRRLRDALGEPYAEMRITARCLGSLYRDLRRTGFRGQALIHENCLHSWEPAGSVRGRYGLVFDIGTTTLVGKLIDMADGREVGALSRLNSQSRYGSNVINRIQFARDKKTGRKRLRELLIADLNWITSRLLEAGGLVPEDVFIAVAAGNTTMQHFLLDLDPSGIAEAPFVPVITEGVTFRTADLGLNMNPDAVLYVMPCRSGYIGGDLISFILCSGAAQETGRMILGLDFGTNGEIFLGNRLRMLTCSAAAGPALEGARISRGMIARAGAIESVRVRDNNLQYNVIGNIKAKGLCGSGLVDLAAVLLHYGVIDTQGLMGPQQISEEGDLFRSRVLPVKDQPVFDFLVAGRYQSFNRKEILLTQMDVRELQLAKAAVAAGVQVLMQRMAVTVEDIDTIYLAGALGNYVNPYSAMRIGLIPSIAPERIVSLGNAASAGARLALLSKSHWRESTDIARRIEHIELSIQPDFEAYFIDAMDFPTDNLW
jgi:uncharacterized 2Fe-2S/4Fe-4S cluster protein (DUF4445 family)